MKVKTFQGRTMAEALAHLKREFGRTAVILTTRTFMRGGFLGIGGKPCVEITAAREMQEVPAPLRRNSVRMRSSSPDTAAPTWTLGGRDTSVQAPTSNGHGTRLPQFSVPRPIRNQPAAGDSSPRTAISPDPMLAEMGSLKSMISDLVQETRRARAPQLPTDLYETYQALISNAVAEELAAKMVEQVRSTLAPDELKNERVVRAALAEQLIPSIPAAGPICLPPKVKPYIVALVGPTGVGKTTTIAKLAANFCLRDNRKVGMITLDTYRIAAVEQLKTYAQIIDVPLEVAASADQLKESVSRLSHCDVILIDTAGRSQRDASKLRQLGAYFAAVRPHETHLVLSSAAGQKVLDETIDRFCEIGVDRVIFTKLDEALGFGVIVNCLQKANAKLSYVTTGQDVPSDIEIAEPKALAELILSSCGC